VALTGPESTQSRVSETGIECRAIESSAIAFETEDVSSDGPFGSTTPVSFTIRTRR